MTNEIDKLGLADRQNLLEEISARSIQELDVEMRTFRVLYMKHGFRTIGDLLDVVQSEDGYQKLCSVGGVGDVTMFDIIHNLITVAGVPLDVFDDSFLPELGEIVDEGLFDEIYLSKLNKPEEHKFPETLEDYMARVYNTQIEYLDLEVRTYNNLRRHEGMTKIGELIDVVGSENALRKMMYMRGVGDTTLIEIVSKLVNNFNLPLNQFDVSLAPILREVVDRQVLLDAGFTEGQIDKKVMLVKIKK